MIKPVHGYENKYLISDNGEVFSISTRWGSKQPTLRKPVRGKVGYLVVSLWKDNKESIKYIHRLLAEHFIDKPDAAKNYINHKDGNKLNNSLDNLEWVTQKENNQHSIRTGLNKYFGRGTKPGDLCPSSKLTSQEVIEIRKLYPMIGSEQLAKRYNVTTTNIRMIINRKTWKHI